MLSKKYGELIDTLKYTNLFRYFVSEDIITLEDRDKILSEKDPHEKIELVLRKVIYALKARDTKPFYSLLKVMKHNGDSTTKILGESIEESLVSSTADSVKRGTLIQCI